jgi:VWFA-related protein
MTDDMGKLKETPDSGIPHRVAALACLPRSIPLLASLLLTVQLNAQDAPQFRINTDLVTVPAAVTDRHGVAVSDMTLPEFRLFDDGARTDIDRLWRDTDLPFTVGIIVDISWSEQDSIPKEREAVRQFLENIMRSGDRAFLATTATRTRLVSDLTGSLDQLRKSLESVRLESSGMAAGEPLGEACRTQNKGTKVVSVCGGSTIWDSVYAASQLKLRPLDGAKAIVILSDGIDTGSLHGVNQTIDELKSSGTVVYAIKVGDWRAALLRGLDKLVQSTGGLVLRPKGDDFATAFRRIEADLRTRYILGFRPSETARPGTHSVRVEVTRPQASVRFRSGYYHPGPPDGIAR